MNYNLDGEDDYVFVTELLKKRGKKPFIKTDF